MTVGTASVLVPASQAKKIKVMQVNQYTVLTNHINHGELFPFLPLLLTPFSCNVALWSVLHLLARAIMELNSRIPLQPSHVLSNSPKRSNCNKELVNGLPTYYTMILHCKIHLWPARIKLCWRANNKMVTSLYRLRTPLPTNIHLSKQLRPPGVISLNVHLLEKQSSL